MCLFVRDFPKTRWCWVGRPFGRLAGGLESGQRSNLDPPELVAKMFYQAQATTYLSMIGMGRSVSVDLGQGVRINGGRRNGPGLCVRTGRSASGTTRAATHKLSIKPSWPHSRVTWPSGWNDAQHDGYRLNQLVFFWWNPNSPFTPSDTREPCW